MQQLFQLSLYVDKDILKKIETAAKMNDVSISKFVSDSLKEYFSGNWPKGFDSVFGSISDETFTRHDSEEFNADTVRENL